MYSKKSKNKLILIIITLLITIIAYPMLIFAADTTGDTTVAQTQGESITSQIRDSVAMWYVIARYFAIAAMLLVLVYLGIKLSINTVASEKATYKKMLTDWLVGFILLFVMHYFMIIVIKINESLIDIIVKIGGYTEDGFSLYHTVRTRAYSMKFSVGVPAAVMYMLLVYYTIKYLIIYIRRYINVIILTITAPIVCLMNTFQKIKSGKGMSLNKWFEEYLVNVLVQMVHVLVYVLCMQIALKMAEENFLYVVVSIVALKFMSEADKLFRKIFKLGGSGGADSGVKDLFAPAKAVKGVMASGAVKQITNKADDFVKRKGSEFVDKRLENRVNKKLNSITDSDLADIKDKRERRNALAAELKEYRLEQVRNGNRGPIRLSDEMLAKEKEMKMLDKKVKKFDDLITKYSQVDEDGYLRAVKRDVKYDENGNKIGGHSLSSMKLEDFENRVFGANGKKYAIELTKMGGNAIKGMGQVFVGIPLLIDEPAVGLALLAKGRKNMKPLFGSSVKKGAVSQLEQFRLSKANKQARKNKNITGVRKVQNNNSETTEEKTETYTFNRFERGALTNIAMQLNGNRYGRIVERLTGISGRLDNPNLAVKVFTTPMRFTGQVNVAQNLGNFMLNIAKENEEEEIKTYKQYAVELHATVSREYISEYDKKVKTIRKKAKEESTKGLIESRKVNLEQIVDLTEGKRIQFKTNQSVLEQGRIVDVVLVNVAIDMNLTDLEQLDMNNNDVQERIIEELEKKGIISDSDSISDEEKSKLIKTVRKRKDSLSDAENDPVKERIIENIVAEIAAETDISSTEQLQENSEEIVEKVLETVGTGEGSDEITKIVSQVLDNAVIIKEEEDITYTKDEESLIEDIEDTSKVGETKSKTQEVIEYLREGFATSKIAEMNEEISKAEELLDKLQEEKDSRFVPWDRQPDEIDYDSIITDQNIDFVDILQKIVEERQIQEAAKIELGVAPKSKHYKTMQFVQEQQKEQTIYKTTPHRKTLEEKIEEINLDLNSFEFGSEGNDEEDT